MGVSETGQVSKNAAKIYEAVYPPALFSKWCPVVMQAANIQPSDSVVDVACGTGALAIAVSNFLSLDGRSVGIDINNGMLEVARSKSSHVEWINAPAEALPFPDNSFDCVVCQFGLMYFENQEAALGEMLRVLKPAGSLAVAVWDTLENNPGLAAEEYLWQRVFGGEVEEAPYRLGDKGLLEQLFRTSGFRDIELHTVEGTASFESIESWIHTGAMGWTEDEALTESELDLLMGTAEKELTAFVTDQGRVSFSTSAHIVAAQK